MEVGDRHLTCKIISNRVLFQMYLTLNNTKQSDENQKETGVSGAGTAGVGWTPRQRRLPT